MARLGRRLAFGVHGVWKALLALLAVSLAANLALLLSVTALNAASGVVAALGGSAPYLALRRDNAALQDQVAVLRRNLDVRAGRVRALESEVRTRDDRLAAQATSINEKNTRLERQAGDIRRKDERLAILAATLDQKKDFIERQRTAIAQKERELRLTREIVERRTSDLAARIERVAGRRLGGVFVKSVPVVGTVAVAALTAYELEQDCAVVRDLAGLREEVGVAKAVETRTSTVCGYEVPALEEIYQTVFAAPGEVWRRARDQSPQLPAWNPGVLVPDIGLYDWFGWIGSLFGSSRKDAAE